MRFVVKRGTGRAHCRICRKIIEETNVQVTVGSWHSTGSVHLKCLNIEARGIQLEE